MNPRQILHKLVWSLFIHQRNTKKVTILTGKNLSYHCHYKRDEIWTILKGEAEFILDDLKYTIKAGDVLKITAGTRHAVRALSDVELIEIQSGSDIFEDDIHSFHINWEEIMEFIEVKVEGCDE